MSVGTLSPLVKVEAYSPSDTTVFDEASRAILIAADGAVAVRMMQDGPTVTIANLIGGIWHPMRCIQILATGTDASTVYVGR